MMKVFLLGFALFCVALSATTQEPIQENGLFHKTTTKLSKNEVEMTLESYAPGVVNLDFLESFPEPVGKVMVGAWDFIPAQIPDVAILANGPEVTWEGSCFKKITASLVANETAGTLILHPSQKRSAICTEFYDFGDREYIYLVPLEVSLAHKVHINNFRPNEYQDLLQNGMKAFLFPGNVPEVIQSVRKTLALYKPGPQNAQANIDFLADKMEWQMTKRNSGQVKIPAEEIKSGDYFAVGGYDGVASVIMWGTGGHTDHTAVALWFGDELYVCESTDVATNQNGSLGIMKTPYEQWVNSHAQSMVALLRLSDEYQKQFDENKAIEWFKTVEGMPYGWHNFVYSFLDTMYDNLPRPVTPDLMSQVFGIYEPMFPPTSKSSLYSMFIMGLNHRLGSNCETMECIYNIIDPEMRNLFEVISIPENQEWKYDGNGCTHPEGCYSMVCDVFVMQMYQNAGLHFPHFQATEFTPKDTYELAIFDAHWGKNRPRACKEADPYLPYCQISGDYVLSMPGYNSREPYENMNNACPAYAPVYMRTPHNC